MQCQSFESIYRKIIQTILRTTFGGGNKQATKEFIDPGQAGRHLETEKWIYPSIIEAYGELGDGLPTITIDTSSGCTRERKDRVVLLICDLFERVMGTRDVYVLLRTTEAEDHIGAGKALSTWKP